MASPYTQCTFVPGHGEVGTARDLAVFRDYLMTSMTSAVIPALKRRYGQWEYFDQAAKDNALQIEAELSGTKRVPR
jgi:hypothetical protein